MMTAISAKPIRFADRNCGRGCPKKVDMSRSVKISPDFNEFRI